MRLFSDHFRISKACSCTSQEVLLHIIYSWVMSFSVWKTLALAILFFYLIVSHLPWFDSNVSLRAIDIINIHHHYYYNYLLSSFESGRWLHGKNLVGVGDIIELSSSSSSSSLPLFFPYLFSTLFYSFLLFSFYFFLFFIQHLPG